MYIFPFGKAARATCTVSFGMSGIFWGCIDIVTHGLKQDLMLSLPRFEMLQLNSPTVSSLTLEPLF